MPEKLYTVQDLEPILGIKAQHIRKLIDSGRLKGINLGFGKIKRRRVTEAALNEFLNTPMQPEPQKEQVEPSKRVHQEQPKLVPLRHLKRRNVPDDQKFYTPLQ